MRSSKMKSSKATKNKKRLYNKKIFYGIVILLLIGLSLFILNDHYITILERLDKLIKFSPTISEACGIEQCHGLKISCGPNIPKICTMEFRIEDYCRKYIYCKKVGRDCQLIKEPKFEECKSCIEKCEKENDAEKAFQCASKCVE